MKRWRRTVGWTVTALLGAGIALPMGQPAQAEPDAWERMDGAVAAAAGLVPEGSKQGETAALPTRGDRVVVYVEGDDAAALARTVASVDGVVSDTGGQRVRAAVAPEALEKLAGSPGVREVRRPDTAVPMTISEGVQPSGALAWHDTDQQGAGVKVGIIDVGFGRLEATQNNGELPADVTVYNGLCGAEHDNDHGTTMAEVVHDMAPQADLYLACVTDSMDFDDAARWLADQGVQVVNVALGFPGTGRGDGLPHPNDPDWSPATVVAWLRGQGILVVSAAGNQAERHMTGRTEDSDGDGWMNISGNAESLSFAAPAGSTVTIELKWDAWPRTNQDLDLYVTDDPNSPDGLNDPNLVGRSLRAQKDTPGGLSPVETVEFVNTTGGVQTYWLYVKSNGAAQTLRYDLTGYGPTTEFSHKDPAGSVVEPASSAFGLAVGAITVDNANTGGATESYSSRGPSIDGRIKPDVTGFTNVSTFTGGASSAGTSVASAHVAGAAALYKGANPELDPAELEALLLDSSSRPGRGNAFGYGVLNLGSARIPQPPAGDAYTPLQTPDRVLDDVRLDVDETLTISDLPTDATAVVLSVFGNNTAAATSLQVFADRTTDVDAVDILPGRNNQIVVPVTMHPRDRVVRIRNTSAAVRATVDVLGYFSPSGGSTYFPMENPVTLLDTRTWGVGSPKLGDAEVQTIGVRGVAGVPSNATAAVVNVTAAEASATTTMDVYGDNWPVPGTVTAYPDDQVTKMTVVPIGGDGAIRVRGRGGEAHVAVDLVGWFGTGDGGARYVPMRYTERVFDTRTGSHTPPSPFGTGRSREFRVTLQPRVPVDASAAWLSLRATSRSTAPTTIGVWAREYPWKGHTSLAAQWYETDGRSTGSVQSNSVLTPLGTTGVIGLRNDLATAPTGPIRGTPDMMAALQGYFVGGEAAAPAEPPAPTGYWRFNEADGTAVADVSGNGRPITLQGGAERIGGRTGRAAWLDGSTGFGTTAGPVLRTDQSFSVSAWAYKTKTGAMAVVGQDGDRLSGFMLENLGDRWSFSSVPIDAGGDPTTPVARAVDSEPTRLGEWTHLVGVYDAPAHQLRLFVNGAFAGVYQGATLWRADGPLTIGVAKWNGNRAGHFSRGIDEVRTFDRPLSESEVRRLHGETAAVLLDRWTFDEGTGTIAEDVTSRTNDGVLTGGASWTSGVSGGAVQLDGASGFVGMPVRAVISKDSFTVTAWAKLSGTGWATVVAQDGNRNSPFFLQYTPSRNRWMFGGMTGDTDSSPGLRSALSSGPPALDEWIHLAGVYDAGARQLRLYVDGKLAGTADGATPFNGVGGFTVGRAKYRGNQVNHFDGAIDDVRTYHGMLTEDQIRSLATS